MYLGNNYVETNIISGVGNSQTTGVGLTCLILIIGKLNAMLTTARLNNEFSPRSIMVPNFDSTLFLRALIAQQTQL